MIATDETPRVWVGCLACYNGGTLRGEWYDAAEAGEVTPEDIHGGPTSHEELWVFDHENLPISGECSPMDAARIAEVLDEIDAPLDAVRGYVEYTGAEYDQGLREAFEEAYQGEWRSEEEFAQQLAEDLGALPEDYSWPASYIDWERATRDLFMGDYWSYEASSGLVYVFRAV